MENLKDKLIQEKIELDKKIVENYKLLKRLREDCADTELCSKVNTQITLMQGYSNVLNERINLF